MMKLLKYDVKRNATTFLSVGTILILVQLILSITGNARGWEQPVIYILSFMLYSFTATIIYIVLIRSYRHNIKAYSRRLLPIRSIWLILSVVVLSWLTLIALIGIIILHVALYGYLIGFQYVDVQVMKALPVALVLLFQMFWWYTFLFIAIVLSSTISASIRGKLGTWIGIISFFVIQSVLSWIEVKLLNLTNGVGIDSMSMVVVRRSVTSNVDVPGLSTMVNSGVLTIDWLSVLIETVFMALMLYATVLLLNRREQV